MGRAGEMETGVSRKRAFLFALQGGVCAFCGAQSTLSGPKADPLFRTLEHIQPRKLRGPNVISNLVGCCTRCNEGRNRRMWTTDPALFLATCLAEREFVNTHRVLGNGYEAETASPGVTVSKRELAPSGGLCVPPDLTPRFDLIVITKCKAEHCSRKLVGEKGRDNLTEYYCKRCKRTAAEQRRRTRNQIRNAATPDDWASNSAAGPKALWPTTEGVSDTGHLRRSAVREQDGQASRSVHDRIPSRHTDHKT